MKSIKSSFFLVGILLPYFAFAQSNPNTDPNQIHFRVLAWENALSELFLSQVAPPLPDPQHPTQSLPPVSNYQEKPIYIPFKFRSEFALCDKTKPLYFIRHVGDLYKIVATVDLSTSGDYPLLFFQSTKIPDDYSVSVIPDDPITLPSGAVRFMNFSPIPATAYFDQTAIELPPNADKVVVPPEPKSGKVLYFQLVRNTDGKCEYSNPWRGSSTNRTILFITDDRKKPESIEFIQLVESMKSAMPEGELQQYK